LEYLLAEFRTDPVEALKVDALLDTVTEASLPVEMSVQGAVKRLIQDEPWTKEEVTAVRKRLASNKDNGLPFYLSYFENILKNNSSGWLVGDKVTIADIGLSRIVVWVGSGMLDGIPKELIDEYPLVKANREKIEALPEVIGWREAHPIPYADSEFKL
jgi:glutathione S-transferase